MDAGNELAAQGQGAFGWLLTTTVAGGNLAFGFEAVVFPKSHAFIGRKIVDLFHPLTSELVLMIAHEYEGGEGAIGRGIGVVGFCEV